jgi:peptidoglycan-N-acetylglucosamine deacetylase
MKKLFFILSVSFLCHFFYGDVINKFETQEKVIAITFDACETKTPSYFDEKILSYLIENKIPATFFISGKFAKRNKDKIAEISKLGFLEIENHSLNHNNNMEKLSENEIKNEVMENDKILSEITGKKPKFFRFPAGNYDKKTLNIVESLGYKVVHWSIVSGDPDKKITADRLIKGVVPQVKPGKIIIFHINGRGWHTGEALPEIVKILKEKGFSFSKLEDCIK